MAAAEEEEWVECGFCCRKNEAMKEPKCLPCGHVHCFGCLTDSFESIHIVQCPEVDCRQVFDVKLSTLPAHDMKGGNTESCDVYEKRQKCNEEANMYCIQCNKRFCGKHEEFHDAIFGEHTTIGMDVYKTKRTKLEMRMCEVHKDQPYNAGCKKCLTVICVGCLSEQGVCMDGGGHQFMPIDELVKVLKKEINDLKEKVLDKEEILCELFKQTSKKVSEYDDATKEMVKLIHQTRDEQLAALNTKYKKLEEEMVRARLEVRAEMVEFLEDKVGAEWNELRNQRQKIDGRHKHSHQCDIVSGFKETKNEIQRLIDDLLPTLDIPKCTSLCTRDECRDIELAVLSVDGVQIGIQLEETTPISPPKSLTLLNTVKLSQCVTSVCSYEEFTYVGSYSGYITKVDGSFSESSFASFDKDVAGLVVYKDRVYSKLYGSPSVIRVHDLSGKLLDTWDHPDSDGYCGIAVCSDQLVVPDRENKQLVVYTLTGSVVKRISCDHINFNGWVSLCAGGDNCVVVSDFDASKVFKVDISSGDIKWSCTKIAKPQGVTCYREKYVVVASEGSNALNIIDVHTGDVVTQITQQDVCGSGNNLFDMHISGDTLVIANCNMKSVVYFKLNM